jgi:hypothetical protein
MEALYFIIMIWSEAFSNNTVYKHLLILTLFKNRIIFIKTPKLFRIYIKLTLIFLFQPNVSFEIKNLTKYITNVIIRLLKEKRY